MSSTRHFEGQDHAQLYAKYRPTPPPTLLKILLDFLREEYHGPLGLAVDLGCGNGQCTFTLANEFLSVLGTDISAAQIAEATELCTKLKCENVKFQASSAEEIPVFDNSVQLITVCEAAHWMDLPKVFNEARRVLSPNGVFAIIGYHYPIYIPREEDLAKSDAINKIVDTVVKKTMEYWPKEAFVCFSEYSDVTIPFSNFKRERNIPFTRTAKLADIEGCILSYSTFRNYCKQKENGEAEGKKLLESLKIGLVSALNEGRETPYTDEELQDYDFTETFNYFVLMARI